MGNSNKDRIAALAPGESFTTTSTQQSACGCIAYYLKKTGEDKVFTTSVVNGEVVVTRIK